MAVDTAEKRFSMIEFGDGSMGMMFQVDGAVDLDDRQHLLGCYAGLAFAAIAVSPEICWPLTVAFTDNGSTTAAVSAIWKTTIALTNSGATTVIKGC